MKDKNKTFIRELEMAKKHLSYPQHNSSNPKIIQRVAKIQAEVISLIKYIEQLENSKTTKKQPTSVNPQQKASNTSKKPKHHVGGSKKKQRHPRKQTQQKKIHLAPTGRNTFRASSLFNPQGGFKPSGSTYHIKDYDD